MTLFHQQGFLQRLRQGYSSSQSVVFINVIQLALKVVLSNTYSLVGRTIRPALVNVKTKV
ncbi:hypothetical protein EFP23_01060 [Lacticaseibacillus paracasei]|nr:hypothetical protein [Lacticaseibacillus paracasei]MCT3343253.1 hypothetical protein [Lacticaseibacillus paracasei]QHC80665.1 hypothetical protein F5J09_01860 [Lacticaseibacillus paracasei]RDF85242.1 hypothetical protein DQM24_03325 [Lacticaseibacillus paracasei]